MNKLTIMAGLLLASISGSAQATLVSLDAIQTGGFYGPGLAPDNSPAFQNYFVGYGTTPGFGRTPERRSFFWFSLAGISEPIASATIHLTLPFGGMIKGKGPGIPGVDPIVDDDIELFQLGATAFAPGFVTSPILSAGEALAIFGSFSTAIADPFCFGASCPGPPLVAPADIAIDLDASGLAFLNGHLGGDVVLTGWMPSWTPDDRPDLSPPPDFFEASELIFGLTDVVPFPAVPKPKLDLVTVSAVPEPSPAILLITALVFGFGRRIFRRA